VNIEQFVNLLINSRLSSKQEAEELATIFQDECRTRDTQDTLDLFCDFLISTHRLTAWQCDKLRKGKWKGFYLDNYLLLEQIGKDEDFSYFKARDARDGKLVRLAVTPMKRAKGPGIEYRVDPYSE
jgi:hypothetical protein